LARLLAPAFKTPEGRTEQKPPQPATKRVEETSRTPRERSSGKEHEEEGGKRPEKNAAGAKKDVLPAMERNRSKKNTSSDRTEKARRKDKLVLMSERSACAHGGDY
jgi:hypothetical protein